jgi:DNA-binding CsgD family transcriptional regulator
MKIREHAALTLRESEILKLIGKAKSSKEIADALGLSVLTVNNHRKHICGKLDIHSTAELVAYAVQFSNTH